MFGIVNCLTLFSIEPFKALSSATAPVLLVRVTFYYFLCAIAPMLRIEAYFALSVAIGEGLFI